MTSAKISGMVSTPGTLDTGLSKVTGTVEKGLCATAQASFASVMEQKTSGYGNQQLTRYVGDYYKFQEVYEEKNLQQQPHSRQL